MDHGVVQCPSVICVEVSNWGVSDARIFDEISAYSETGAVGIFLLGSEICDDAKVSYHSSVWCILGRHEENVLVPAVSPCLYPWASPATSFEHVLSQFSVSGPFMRCLYSNWLPVIGHCTAFSTSFFLMKLRMSGSFVI